MASFFDDVREFCRKFGRPHHPNNVPRLLTQKEQDFWLKFIFEEAVEFHAGWVEGAIEKAGDALVDLVYVALHTAHNMGLPFEEMWDEVQRCNMAKERATGDDDPRSTRHSAMDVVKPEGWTPPNHGPILKRADRDWLARERLKGIGPFTGK